jgi:hypothetical protein
MTEVEMETKYLVVVGMNRPRLNKIMSLVEERRQSAAILITTDEEDGDSSSSVTPLSVKLVPCLAAMGSYADENGNSVRYLSNVVYHDGSPMTTYFDDPSFRENLDSVLLVGYEWQANDDDMDKIQGYFKANQLEISVQCVLPDPKFDNLQDEMEAFKGLDDDVKEQCLVDGSMGPAKMAKAIVDSIYQIKKVKVDSSKREKEEAKRAVESTTATHDDEEESSSSSSSKQERKPQHDPADPSRPRYACRMCRTILFGENHLAQDHIQNRHSFNKMNHHTSNGIRSTPAATCQSIFCSDDVLQWLSPSGEDIEGKLACPRCSHKIGHWKWAGAQCSCGTWVTPAIQIPASKVDVVAPAHENAATELVGRVVNPIILPSENSQ